MRILLDESVPERVGSLLQGHTWSTVQREGWAGMKNGLLLSTAAQSFDALLTADKNMAFQQNLAALPMRVVILRAASNRFDDLADVVPAALRALAALPPRTLVSVPA